jgi:hypothetical protein
MVVEVAAGRKKKKKKKKEIVLVVVVKIDVVLYVWMLLSLFLPVLKTAAVVLALNSMNLHLNEHGEMIEISHSHHLLPPLAEEERGLSVIALVSVNVMMMKNQRVLLLVTVSLVVAVTMNS